ncbi:MAG: hypothetical protein ACLRUO_04435 [Beduini sp.]|uniref:MarR family transcriptional regulator n=2 Tax=Beduini sp. TaxID=1922300 RepID=UPI0011C856F0
MNAFNTLGLKLNIKDWDKTNQLPFYILNDFTIQKATINDISCLSLTPHEGLPNLTALKKQINVIKNVEDLPVFLNLDSISNFRKQNLLENKIAFILKDKMVYLPFMTTLITDEQCEENKKIEKLTLASQLLFIWILHQDTDKFYISEALETISVSNMTLTRAYRQLCATKLFEEHKDGRKIYLTTHFNKLDLFYKMKEYLQSPIQKQGYILKFNLSDDMVLSAESALSQYTFINPPKLKTYAIDKANSKQINLQKDYYSVEEQVELQIWNYNPLLFSRDKKNIDKISLIISSLGNTDERLEIEIEQLLESIFNKEGA